MARLTIVNGIQTAYTETLLPDATLRRANSAFEGSYMAHIEVYDIMLSDTIQQEEIGNMAGERIVDNGINVWVKR